MQSTWTQRSRVHYYTSDYSAKMLTFTDMQQNQSTHTHYTINLILMLSFLTVLGYPSSSLLLRLPFIWLRQQMANILFKVLFVSVLKQHPDWSRSSQHCWEVPYFLSSHLPFQIPGLLVPSACQATKRPSRHLCISSFINILLASILFSDIYFWEQSVYSAHSFHSANSEQLEKNRQHNSKIKHNTNFDMKKYKSKLCSGECRIQGIEKLFPVEAWRRAIKFG